MGQLGEKVAGIIAAIIAVSVVALVVSARANTANVFGAFFNGLSQLIGTAVSPVTGQAPALAGGSWANGAGIGGGYSNLINAGQSSLSAGFANGSSAFGINIPSSLVSSAANGIGSGLGNLFGSGGGGGFIDSGTF